MKYIVGIPATARGTQWWRVDAESPKDAVEKIKAGVGHFDCEEMETEFLEYGSADVTEDK